MNSNSEKIQKMVERLKTGVSIAELSAGDIETVRQIQDGGDFIILSSADASIEEKIEEAAPFCFELVETETGGIAVEIQPDGAPNASFTPAPGSVSTDAFVLDGDVRLSIWQF